MNKIKDYIMVIVFIGILMVTFVINIVVKDVEVSETERRKLAQFPTFTSKSIFNGDAFKKFEDYTVDQFVGRDSFRKIKYMFSTNIYNAQDNNKAFVYNGGIYKMEYPTNEVAIEKSVKKLQDVYDKHLNGMNVYYSIIPDKNYYLEDEHLKLDVALVEKIMAENLKDAQYIDIKKYLEVEDYYSTDIHWRQENILDVADELLSEMTTYIVDTKYKKNTAGTFKGTYYGQVGITLPEDNLVYLTSRVLDNATTYNYETKKTGSIYDLEKFNNSIDKYDIFVSGATPLIEINNLDATTTRELIVFRDSFGSSLAPLLVSKYSKVTLVDLRYMSSNLLEQYIDFNTQDVLFIYSTTVLNQNILR